MVPNNEKVRDEVTERQVTERQVAEREVAELDVPGLIRRVRRVLRVSQRGLAERLGVSAGLVGGWESGEREPSLALFQTLLGLADLQLAVTTVEGAAVRPMGSPETVRDRGGRFCPAHLEVVPTLDTSERCEDGPRLVKIEGRSGWCRGRMFSEVVAATDPLTSDHMTAMRAESFYRELYERRRAPARAALERIRARTRELERARREREGEADALCECPMDCYESRWCGEECPCQCEALSDPLAGEVAVASSAW